MNKIIPILPCQSIKDQVAFYEDLGFQTIQTSNHHSPYAALSFGSIELHFYGSKKTLPHENPSMCFIVVEDVDRTYEAFTTRYKQLHGKIPRSGIPRISKLKDLAADRRFIVTDQGGNTLFIGTPNPLNGTAFYRTVKNEKYAKHFEILYDLLYSKEDCLTAYNMLKKFFPEDLPAIEADPLDQAKILLVALDLYHQKDNLIHSKIKDRLLQLFNEADMQAPDWYKLQKRYEEIIRLD